MKQGYSVKDILTAVDNILNVKSTQESKKKITNEIPAKDILSAVDNILKVKSIQAPAKEIVNEIYQKNDNEKKIAKNPEYKKKDQMEKKYDLLVINNAKDILILNRIIFK